MRRGLPRERGGDAGVDGEDATRRRARTIGEEERDPLGDVFRPDLAAEQAALRVERLQLLRLDAVRGGALGAHLVREETRACEDRVGIDDVRANPERAA